jgi:hypothetical protein
MTYVQREHKITTWSFISRKNIPYSVSIKLKIKFAFIVDSSDNKP